MFHAAIGMSDTCSRRRTPENIHSKCQRKGTRTKRKPMKENAEKTLLGGSPPYILLVAEILVGGRRRTRVGQDESQSEANGPFRVKAAGKRKVAESQ